MLNSAAREESFHEDYYLNNEVSKSVDPLALFEGVSAFENKFILNFFGSLKDKTVIDAGAGTGESSVYFALKGARVIWSDISGVACGRAQELARRLAVADRITFLKGNLSDVLKERQGEPADFIYGNGILHHLDWQGMARSFALNLKTGGKFAFIEPLRYNPLIHIYRKMALSMRSPDERPLGFEAVKSLRRFLKVSHREFWLLSLLVFIKFYLIDRVSPDKEPYWKKIFYDADKLKAMLAVTSRFDAFLTRIVPFNYLCWNTVLYGEKA